MNHNRHSFQAANLVKCSGSSPESPTLAGMPLPNRMPTRGFTLIEILLVLSLLGCLLGGTIGLIKIIRDSDQAAKQSHITRQEIRRFANDLRRDVRSADQLAIEEAKLVINTDSPPSEIRYQITANQVERTKSIEPDEIRHSQDRYLIGPDHSSGLKLLENDTAVTWTFTQTDRPDEPIEIIAYRAEKQ